MNEPEPTGAYDPDTAKPTPDVEASLPSRIGRYRVERLLGKGGFGLVYLAHDEQLDRLVALKVPHAQLIRTGEDVEAYLAEARVVAGLDHPHIVPVYDVGTTRECPCFIVSKYIEGVTLAQRIRMDRPTIHRSAELVATIAAALHYAHQSGLVHRDIKPGNILLDKAGQPYVVDFGLAIQEEDINIGPHVAGTGPYMSPEQARGEGHRVDGRSDIFSLGVVFYELLTGRRPFRTEARNEPLEQTTDYEPRPPRQYDDRIPRELERICIKAMAKRATDRYSTAKDMADDLRHFLREDEVGQLATVIAPTVTILSAPAPPSGSLPSTHASATSGGSLTSNPLKIVPKGLRSFDAHDSDFFLELVPGPRDREGLPDSIRFWKTHIEELDADNTFAVGLLYGPSGCGKSSLMKAGLLPRLAERVQVIYIEATADETELRLLQGLRKRCPALPDKLDLTQTLASLRRGQGLPAGRKVLIVLDQFEQWLHARRGQQATELVQALRQCDGSRVQAMLMVRDDFWMGATRFLRELEILLVEGKNSAAVDLFPLRHAEKVLAAFGQAFSILPENLHDLSNDQRQFLQQAVQGLATDGKIICVRLALFAEMMKTKPWSVAALQSVGGAEGVGEAFLEETFSAATAPPLHRVHQQAARAVLKALLPEPGADIKGHRRSHSELQEASGHANSADFFELIYVLDAELRLITPVEAQDGIGSYQLTHDYLVPSLRDWLTRKQKETRRGRAELLLADRASIWNARQENRQLPSFLQWASIHALTHQKHWTESERKMIRQANRYYLTRGFALIAILALLGFGAYEAHGRLQARVLRDRLLDAQISETPRIIEGMTPYRRWVNPLLHEARDEAERERDADKLLHVSLALLPSDPCEADYLYDRLLTANLSQLLVIREALDPHCVELTGKLWTVVEARGRDPDQRFRAACVLARFDPDNSRWQGIADDVAGRLATQNPLEMAGWTEALEPAASVLAPSLANFLEDETRSRAERGLIAKVYGSYAARLPQAIRRLENRLTELPDAKSTDLEKTKLIKKQASCAAALLAIDRGDAVWPLLRHRQDPTLRCFLLDRVAAMGVDPKVLLARLETETDAAVLRSILLGLGDYGLGRLPQAERQIIVPRIEKLYRDHPDAGVHGAADWLMRSWHADVNNKDLATGKISGERRWFVSKQGLTFTVIDAPGEVWLRETDERHRCRVQRRYAIATKEVTVEQYLRFHTERTWDEKLAHSVACPMSAVSWFEAAHYCNWLSARDGLPPEHLCYLPNKEGKYAEGMSLAPDWYQRSGYRLPTEAEWVHAARANADTTFSFGHSVELVNAYVWNAGNSSGRSQPVGTRKPNDWGLFDMHGNVWEWTQDIVHPKKRIDVKLLRDDHVCIREVTSDDYRLQLGGSWGNQSIDVRPTFVSYNKTFQRHPAVGFRPARTMR